MFRTIFRNHQNIQSQLYRTKEQAIAEAENGKLASQHYGICVYDEKLRQIVWIASTEDLESIEQFLPKDVANLLHN